MFESHHYTFHTAIIMDNADSPLTVLISGLLILGSIAFLIIWALQTAYVYG